MRVTDPLPALATQAAPLPIATPTGSVPTTTLRTTRPDSGFVPSTWLRAPSTVQTSPAPRTTAGGFGPGSTTLRSVASDCASTTRSEFGSTDRGAPPTTNRRSSTAAIRPPAKIAPRAIAIRRRVHRVGCRSTFLRNAVFDDGCANATRLLHHRGELRDELQSLAVGDQALEIAELVLEPGGVDGRARHRQDL